MPTRETKAYSGPERRCNHQIEMASISERQDRAEDQMAEVNRRMGGFEVMLKTNTELTQKAAESVARIDANTSAFASLSNDIIGGARFLCRCARGAQWTAEMVRRFWLVACFLIVVYGYSTNQYSLATRFWSFIKP